jgi:hypothetical protein
MTLSGNIRRIGVYWEIFLNKLAENENNIKKMVHIHFEFLKYPNKNAA